MKLVDKNNNEVQRGAKLTSFRGETYYLDGGRPPQHASSEGKVWVFKNKRSLTRQTEMSHELYPSVFDLKWVE